VQGQVARDRALLPPGQDLIQVGLDDHECIVTDLEAEIVDGLVGDRRGDDDSAADVNTDMQLSDPSLL